MVQTFTPQLHNVYNELDQHGDLILNVKRLQGETNREYKRRLLDSRVNKANSTYLGLIYGITRELGLSISNVMTIECTKDSDGEYLLDAPAIKFDDNMVYLISNVDPENYEVYLEIDRHIRTASEWFLGGLVDTINATPYFTATLESTADRWMRSECIFNQNTAGLVISEDVSTSSNRVQLREDHIIPGTFNLVSPNLNDRVATENLVLHAGQYWVDFDHGVIVCWDAPAPGSKAGYWYYDDPKMIQASPVILHNLQKEPFKHKLFETVTNQYNEDIDTIPSILGLDLINELHSVSSVYWGK
jgi:hypothetical protein